MIINLDNIKSLKQGDKIKMIKNSTDTVERKGDILQITNRDDTWNYFINLTTGAQGKFTNDCRFVKEAYLDKIETTNEIILW